MNGTKTDLLRVQLLLNSTPPCCSDAGEGLSSICHITGSIERPNGIHAPSAPSESNQSARSSNCLLLHRQLRVVGIVVSFLTHVGAPASSFLAPIRRHLCRVMHCSALMGPQLLYVTPWQHPHAPHSVKICCRACRGTCDSCHDNTAQRQCNSGSWPVCQRAKTKVQENLACKRKNRVNVCILNEALGISSFEHPLDETEDFINGAATPNDARLPFLSDLIRHLHIRGTLSWRGF